MARAGRKAALLALLALLAPAAADAAGRKQSVPVPRIAIYPGDSIEAGLIIEREFPAVFLARLAVVQGRDSLAGKVAKRTLLPGHPIPVNAVREPDAVTAGVPVQLVFHSGGMIITALATPLKSAQVGEAVSVRNLESGRTVNGIVQTDGSVLVGATQ